MDRWPERRPIARDVEHGDQQIELMGSGVAGADVVLIRVPDLRSWKETTLLEADVIASRERFGEGLTKMREGERGELESE